MGWSTLVDRASNFVVSSAIWNALFGATGNLQYAKDHIDALESEIVIPMKAQEAGGTVLGGRNKINFIASSNVSIVVADDLGNDRINVTISAVGGMAVPTQYQSTSMIFYSVIGPAWSNWIELFASTAFDAAEFSLATGMGSGLVQLGSGSAGAQVAIYEDVSASDVMDRSWKIDAGTHLWVRQYSAAGGSLNGYMHITLRG